MKTQMLVGALALAALMVIPGATATPNPPQSGTTSACLTYNALYLVPAAEPLGNVVVDGGTGYTVSVGGAVAVDAIVDFFDAGGNHVGATDLGWPTNTPPSAVLGVVCVRAAANYPTAPDASGTFTYQDGLP